jgi:hypothetical protein
MLKLLDDAPPGVLAFRAEGRLEPGELAAVVAPPVNAAVERGAPLHVVAEVAAGFAQVDPMAAVAELKEGLDRDLRRQARFVRGAVVSDVAWLTNAVGLMGWMVPGELRTFLPAERDAALAWAAGADG